ncbi:MAG TPA: site-specific integrase [Bryobacteraceae bacterium]
MTQLRKRVLDELERRNYSQATARAYVGAIRRFAVHFHRSPDQLGPEEVRQYQLYLFQERGLQPRSVKLQMSALRFLYVKTLRRDYRREDLPMPKTPRRHPTILSPEEVAKLIESAANLRHRTILMTLYSTGMRCSELTHLQPQDIDKERMVIHIRHGKGGKDRDVPLTPTLREQLRTYWRAAKHKPRTWLFPSLQRRRPDQPIETKTVRHACYQAARRAGITKRVHPHTLRHSFATHLLEGGADVGVIQRLLGHADLRETSVYLHLSTRHLQTPVNPLEALQLDAGAAAGPASE